MCVHTIYEGKFTPLIEQHLGRDRPRRLPAQSFKALMSRDVSVSCWAWLSWLASVAPPTSHGHELRLVSHQSLCGHPSRLPMPLSQQGQALSPNQRLNTKKYNGVLLQREQQASGVTTVGTVGHVWTGTWTGDGDMATCDQKIKMLAKGTRGWTLKCRHETRNTNTCAIRTMPLCACPCKRDARHTDETLWHWTT